jgi:flagellum-specific ATP synthase
MARRPQCSSIGQIWCTRSCHVPGIEVLPWIGEVTEMVGLLIASRGPVVSIGDFVEVRTASGRSIRSQVIGFRNDRVLSMPLEETDGLQPAIA